VTGYLLDNRARPTAGRFAALSALFDAGTARHVDALDIGPGARCWEVGAGGPSVPALLADRVGPLGHVVATDLDVGWMGATPPGVEVRRADVATDEPPGGRFDLVHARLVLVHVAGRDRALRRMTAALRPGGWLLVEDFDVRLQPLACPDPRRDEEHRANRVRAGFLDLLARRGVDLRYGRTLPRRLREAGLTQVAADAAFPVASAAAAALECANVEQVREQLVALGTVTADEVDAHLRDVAAGRVDVATPPLVSAWGRRGEELPCAS
jgi:ubiquinone/menaquinone biosynthesis C-methylase UbiE